MCRITYKPDHLRSINNNQLKPSAELQARLDEITLYKYTKPKTKTKRGCRAGRYKQRQINVVNSQRYVPSQHTISRGVDFDNLVKIQPTSCLPPNNTVPVDGHIWSPDGPNPTPSLTANHGEKVTANQLPVIFMTNAQSLGNKFDDIGVVFDQNNVDVGVVTESWFKDYMPVNQLGVSNYNLFTQSREHKDGGGVNVKEEVPASPIADIEVPPELECLWVKVRHCHEAYPLLQPHHH